MPEPLAINQTFQQSTQIPTLPGRVLRPDEASPVRMTGFPEIENADRLLGDQSIQLPTELIRGVLHQGSKMVLASSSKAGKTWMLLDLAISVATGQPWIKYPTVQGKVLFLNFEIQRAFLRERLYSIRHKRQSGPLCNLDVLNLRGHSIGFEEVIAEVIRRVSEKNYSLIILDPIYKGMVGKDENTSSTVGVLCNELERLGHRTGAAVAFAHHFPKGNQSKKTPMDRMSGSGVFARDADTIITLTEQDTLDCYSMEFTLRNFKAQPACVVQWDFPLLVHREHLDPKALKGKGGRPAEGDSEEMLALLEDGPLTTKEWKKAADEVGITKATFYRKKKQLVSDDEVVEGEDKKWRLAEDAPEASEDGDAPASDLSCHNITPPAEVLAEVLVS